MCQEIFAGSEGEGLKVIKAMNMEHMKIVSKTLRSLIF